MVAIFLLIFGLTLIEGNVQFKKMDFPSSYLTTQMNKQQLKNVKSGIECASLCNAYSARFKSLDYLVNIKLEFFSKIKKTFTLCSTIKIKFQVSFA
jgi:hypothetical protein